MKIGIKKYSDNSVLFSHDVEETTLEISLLAAVKAGANLSGANLDGENISQNPIKLTGMAYWVLISDSYMRIGCQRHSHEEWGKFTDDEIRVMDFGAKLFWDQWKEVFLAMCKTHANKVEK